MTVRKSEDLTPSASTIDSLDVRVKLQHSKTVDDSFESLCRVSVQSSVLKARVCCLHLTRPCEHHGNHSTHTRRLVLSAVRVVCCGGPDSTVPGHAAV